MYCKHCGKIIPDDSRFCQHCGGKTSKNGVDNSKIRNCYQKYYLVYAIWAVIHVVLLCLGEKDIFYSKYGNLYPRDGFYPLGIIDSSRLFCDSFDVRYYDFSEFFTYVFLVPLLILAYFKYLHEPIKRVFHKS